MTRVDYKVHILPDIEMYAGATDVWYVELYNPDGKRYRYEEISDYELELIIKDYGYTHRPNGATYTTVRKTGALAAEPDGADATAVFRFETGDTYGLYGKFTYQIQATCAGNQYLGQGNLYIKKNINQ